MNDVTPENLELIPEALRDALDEPIDVDFDDDGLEVPPEVDDEDDDLAGPLADDETGEVTDA